jgi:hypothetical protein
MAIKPRHKHVDTEGKCYLPGLSQWHGKKSVLVNIIGELQGVFAVNPPVFAKPKDQKSLKPPTNPFAPNNANYNAQRVDPMAESNYNAQRVDPMAESVKTAVTEAVRRHCQEVAQETALFMANQTSLGFLLFFFFFFFFLFFFCFFFFLRKRCFGN